MDMMWSERIGHELYVYWRGELVYKKWYTPKSRPSILLNGKGWPNQWITNHHETNQENPHGPR